MEFYFLLLMTLKYCAVIWNLPPCLFESFLQLSFLSPHSILLLGRWRGILAKVGKELARTNPVLKEKACIS